MSITELLNARANEMEMSKVAELYVQGYSITKIAELCPDGMSKEAWLAAAARLIPGALRLGAKAVRGGGRAAVRGVKGTPGAVRGAGRFARSPLKTTGRWAVKNPLKAGMAGLTVMDAGSQGAKAYRGHMAATSGARSMGRMRQAMQRQARINPTAQYAQMSGF